MISLIDLQDLINSLKMTKFVKISNDNDEMNVDEITCALCDMGDNEESLLLCDGCDKPIHSDCLNISIVPPGDWYCPACTRKGVTRKCAPSKGDYVVLYERVSSKGQNAPEYGRVGMDTQNHTLQKYCFERNMIIRATFTDVGSGRNIERLKEFKRMTKGLKPRTCIMVYSVSRFGRNKEQVQAYLNLLHEKDCYVYSVSEETSSFETSFYELVAQAQRESEALSRKMKESLERRHKEGHWIGPPPYGFEAYRDQRGVRRLCIKESEKKGLKIIMRANDLGPKITALQEKDIPARKGLWTDAKISKAYKKYHEAIELFPECNPECKLD